MRNYFAIYVISQRKTQLFYLVGIRPATNAFKCIVKIGNLY